MTPTGVESACRKHRTKSLSALAAWDRFLVARFEGVQAAVHTDLDVRRLVCNRTETPIPKDGLYGLA